MAHKSPAHWLFRDITARLLLWGRRTAVFSALWAILLICLPHPVLAFEGGQNISVEVSYGYKNVAKGGRHLPVQVVFENKSNEVFMGSIQMKSMESDGTIYLYEYQLILDADGQQTATYYIPIASRADQLYISLLDDQGNIEYGRRLRINTSADVSELFIGILSDTPNRLSYLNGIGISRGSLRTHTFTLSTEQFPEDEIGLDMLDVILVSNYRLRNLSENQTGAIMDWVSGGGVLILGTGGRVDDTLGRFAPELLDDSYGTPELREIDMGMDYATDIPGEHILQITCVDIPLHGGNVISATDEFPLMTATTWDKGLIAVAAYDFIELEDFCLQNSAYVDQTFTRLLGLDRIEQIGEVLFSGNSSKFWSVQNLINTGDVDRLPNLVFYLTVIGIYIFLLGPGLYLGLRYFGIRRYYRRGVLFVSLCFSVIIYLMGARTRFTETFFTYASIQDVTEDFVTDTTYVNIRNPYNTTYEIELDPTYSVLPITRSYYSDRGNPVYFDGSEGYQIAIRSMNESTSIIAQNIVSFTPKYFQMRRKYDNSQKVGIVGDISLFDGKVTGSVTNMFDFPIEDTTVLFYGKMISLSSMDAGETRWLDDLEVINYPVNHPLAIAEEITGESAFTSADIDNSDYLRALERMNLLAFYLDNYMTSYSADARVVAFSSKKEESQFLKKRTSETYGITMLTSSIAVDSYQKDRLYRSVLMKVPTVLSGNYSAVTNSISGREAVTIEYSLGNDIHVESFSLEPLSGAFSQDSDVSYVASFEGNIYFLNYNTGNLDMMPSGKSTFSEEQLQPYLSPGNRLTVRYAHNGGSYSNIVLPMPTVTGREK